MQVSNNSPYVQQTPATTAPAQTAPPVAQTAPPAPAQQSDSVANVPNWTVDLRANTMTTFPSDTMTQNMTFPDRNRTNENDSRFAIRPGDAERFSQPDDIGTNIRRGLDGVVDRLNPAQKALAVVAAGAAEFAVDGDVKFKVKIPF